MTTTITTGKPGRFAREYDLIVSRRRKLLGFGGLDEIILEGTHQHRRYRDWRARLRATEWCMVRAEARYRRMIRELAGDVPVYDGGDALAVAAE